MLHLRRRRSPGICKALCPGGGDFVQQGVAPVVGGGDNLTDRQTHPFARSVTMEEFAGKPTTFVGDWLEKQGIGKLKTLFEGKKHAYVNNLCCSSVARGRGICNFWRPGDGKFAVPRKKIQIPGGRGMVTAGIDRCIRISIAHSITATLDFHVPWPTKLLSDNSF